MDLVAGGLAAIFDGGKGEAFTVLLVVLLVAGAVILVVNLSTRNRPPPAPPQPSWEPVPEQPGAMAEARSGKTTVARPAQPRRPR